MMAERHDQPPLPLDYRQHFGEGDFCVTDTNRDAVEWLAQPDRWPLPVTLLIGPAASGKSHLARLFAERHAARVIDDADMIAEGEPLFHAWNAATPQRPLLFVARRNPRDWSHGLADLGSRLAASPLVRLGDPDDALLAALFAKHLADRGLRVHDDVRDYLLARLERSAAAVANAVAALDILSLAERRDITVPLARALLETQFRLDL